MQLQNDFPILLTALKIKGRLKLESNRFFLTATSLESVATSSASSHTHTHTHTRMHGKMKRERERGEEERDTQSHAKT